MDTCYIKINPPYSKIRQNIITFMSMLLNTAIKGIFREIIHIWKPGAIYVLKFVSVTKHD